MQKQTIEILVQVIKKLRQFPFAELLRFVLLSPYIKIRTCLFQGIDSPMRFRDASAHQGESATDFNFDDNFIEELMRMIAKISDFML